MAGELSFFELGVDDTERARTFYSGLFGWDLATGPSGSGYTIGTPNVPGGMHGGDRGASPYLFFAVDDIEAAVARVQELGGVVEDVDISGSDEQAERFGHFRLCRDDQDSKFGLHQPPR